VYYDTLRNADGCDSIVSLRLKINQPVTRDTVVNTCTPFVWQGKRYDVTGDYTFKTVTVNGCDSTVVLRLKVVKPKSDFAVSDSMMCFNENGFKFINKSSTEYGVRKFRWEFGNGIISDNESPGHRYSNAGSFAVALITTYTEYGCTDTVKRTIRVLPSPARPEVNVIGKPDFCEGEKTYLLTGDAAKYKWYRDGELLLDSTKVMIPKVSGVYMHQYIGSNGCKSEISDGKQIKINKVPKVPVVKEKERLYCIGSVGMPLQVESESGVTLAWYMPGKGDTAVFYTPVPSTLKAGRQDYYVKARGVGGCESDLVGMTVLVGTIRKPELRWEGNELVSDTGYASYGWLMDGKPVDSDKKSKHKPKMAGRFRVLVTNIYGCVDTSGEYNLVVTAINGTQPNSYVNMNIYPNPMKGKVSVDAGERPQKEYTIRVYDARGKTITTVLSKRQVTELNTSGMTSGQYMVEVSEGTKRKTMRVVKSE
jgi:hypothetical protein